MFDHIDPAIVAAPIYIVAMLWERRIVTRRRSAGDDLRGFRRADMWASLKMGMVSILTVGVLNLGVYALAKWLWQWRVTDLGNGVLAWAVGMLAWDFAYYWFHR